MAEQEKYDVVVIGSGPGGYVAAARAAQLGMKTACVEKDSRPGGVCLNTGCIPSKALLDSSLYYYRAKTSFPDHGIRADGLSLDLAAMMERKEQVVRALTDNVRKLLEGAGVERIHGTARLAGENEVAVRPAGSGNQGKERMLSAGRILLATGSRPVAPEGIGIDEDRIVTSTGALSFEAVPQHLVVAGGGYIGLELGSVWARLGAKVTVLEMAPAIAGGGDGQVARRLMRALKGQGLEFMVNTRVLGADAEAGAVSVRIEQNGKKHTLSCDRLLVAAGRRPLTEGLGLEGLGVDLDENGFVRVDAGYRTSVPSVYAIGDLVAGPMLAHKASAEARAAVENMAGLAGEVNYGAIPAVIYTHPEAAWVGLTEEQLKERQIGYCKGTFAFSGAGRARCMGEPEGFVKVLSHAKTDRLLGVHILGARASDMIAEAVLAVEAGASAEDIGRVVHGHPTFAEAFQEAAMAANQCSIYVGES